MKYMHNDWDWSAIFVAIKRLDSCELKIVLRTQLAVLASKPRPMTHVTDVRVGNS